MKQTGTKLILCCVIIFLVQGIIACTPNVDEATLPPLPQVDVANMVPVISTQLDELLQKSRKSPLNAKKVGKLGKALRAYDLNDAAEAAFHRARLLAPSKIDWAYFHAESLLQLGRSDEALTLVQPLLEREAHDPSILLLASKLHVDSGNVAEAEQAIDSLLAIQPLAEAWLLKASLLERVGDIDRAVHALEKALEINGPFGQAHYQLSSLYRQLNDSDKAKHHLTMSRVHKNTRVRPHFGRMGDVLRMNKSDRTLLSRAQVAQANGDEQEVIDLLEQAIEINPNRINTRVGLILGYSAMGQYDQAIRHLEIAQKDKPGDTEVLYAKGRLALAQGQLNTAQLSLQQATEQSGNHADSQTWLGFALLLQGKTTRGAEYFRKALSVDPEHRVARSYYTRLLVAQNDQTLAIQELEKLCQIILPDTPQLLGTLAALYANNQQADKAIATIERGIYLATRYNNDKALGSLKEKRARIELQEKS